jgi:HAD superfamily hydrolase (TIGR01509 family)
MKKALLMDYFGVLVSADRLNTELVALLALVRKRGITVYILSNADTPLAERERERYPELWAQCDKYHYSGATGFIKPDPRAFQQVLEENSLSPLECIYFDDSKTNVIAAQSLGIESFVYTTPALVREKLTLEKML